MKNGKKEKMKERGKKEIEAMKRKGMREERKEGKNERHRKNNSVK